MKKIYTFLLWMVAALLCVPVATAKTVTITVDNPEAVKCSNPLDYQVVPWDENNSVEFTLESEPWIPLNTNAGYLITKIETQSGTELFKGTSTSESINSALLADGDVVLVSTAEKEPKLVKIIGNPEQVYVKDEDYQELHAEDMTDGAWNIELKKDYGSFNIYANDGYKITSVKDQDGNSFLYSSMASYAYIASSNIPYGHTTLTVESKSEAELYDGHVVVNVNGDAEAVDLRFDNSYTRVSLKAGKNDLYFDTATAFPITIEHYYNSPYNPESLYKVSLNGTVLEAVDRVYTLETLNYDDVIDIEVDAPAKDIKVGISFADDESREAVKSLKLGDENVDLDNCKSINTTTGKKIVFELDDSNYDVTLTENGEPVELYYGSYSKKFLDEIDYEYLITAKAKQPLKVKVICENYEHLKISSDYYGYNLYTLTGVETELTVKPADNYAYFKTDEGWYIKSMTNADTNETLSDSFYLTDGLTVFVEVEEFIRDKHFVLYTQPDVWDYLTMVLNPSSYDFRKQFEPEPGYSVIAFNDSDRPFGISGYDERGYLDGAPAVYLNGELCENDWGAYPALENVEDGDVIKLMRNDAPLHNVTYNVAEGIEVTVRHDLEKTVDHTAAHSVHAGTEIHVIPALAGTVKVKAGETELVADEEGKFVHTVTEPVEIVVAHSGSSSILDIEAAAGEVVAVYNLQGVCVRKAATAAEISTLPAGVYVTSEGKKIVVK
ncbi:MAG: hypothetical protein K2K68_04295 [Duncaniella sp.]|nr:hypothetical protein [Duncaniella sp.]